MPPEALPLPYWASAVPAGAEEKTSRVVYHNQGCPYCVTMFKKWGMHEVQPELTHVGGVFAHPNRVHPDDVITVVECNASNQDRCKNKVDHFPQAFVGGVALQSWEELVVPTPSWGVRVRYGCEDVTRTVVYHTATCQHCRRMMKSVVDRDASSLNLAHCTAPVQFVEVKAHDSASTCRNTLTHYPQAFHNRRDLGSWQALFK